MCGWGWGDASGFGEGVGEGGGVEGFSDSGKEVGGGGGDCYSCPAAKDHSR